MARKSGEGCASGAFCFEGRRIETVRSGAAREGGQRCACSDGNCRAAPEGFVAGINWFGTEFFRNLLRCCCGRASREGVPTKKSVLVEPVEFARQRSVGCPSNVYLLFLCVFRSPSRLPNSRCPANRGSCPAALAVGLAAFQPWPARSFACH